jgi:integrase/recombinase XerD
MDHPVKYPGTYWRKAEGPLVPYVEPFAELLREQGFGEGSTGMQIRLVFDFSRWLEQNRVPLGEIAAETVTRYLRCRAHRRRALKGDRPALRRLLDLLRRKGVIIPEHVAPSETTPAEHSAEQYASYLRHDRALAASTIHAYRSFVVVFLTACFDAGKVRLEDLRAVDIVKFVQRQAPHLHPKRAHVMTTALRSFLRYARHRGEITLDLTGAVPRVALWTMASLPRAISPAHVQAVLAHCDRRGAVGRREYAILLLLARLGLRAGEIAALTLKDIDWENGHLSVRGKGNRPCPLPLPAEEGEAIADYLQNGRPRSASRSLFLRAKAPFCGFSGQQAIGLVIMRALERAGIKTASKGAHQFRHALATQMLHQGASLAEIGELLRHRRVDTSRIYAKVDLTALRTLALPWPGGVR